MSATEERVLAAMGLPGAESEVTEPEAPETRTEAVPEFAELEWDGKKINVPVALKDAFMRNEDYTRKTQELAEHRRSYDQMRELAQNRQVENAFQQSVSGELQEMAVIDAYLAQVSKTDMTSMPLEQLMRSRIEIDNVKERRQSLKDAIDSKRNKFNDDVKSKLAELRGKSREMVSKSIQGFSEQTEKDIRTYAQSEGLTDSEIDNVMLDARSTKVLWKAMQFDKVKAGTSQVPGKIDKVLKPGGTSERMPADVRSKLEFNKALKTAKTSGEKANVIEQRLQGMFGRKQ